MKKQYINPEMEIVEVASPQILAGSITVDFGTGTIDPSSAESIEFNDLSDMNDIMKMLGGL